MFLSLNVKLKLKLDKYGENFYSAGSQELRRDNMERRSEGKWHAAKRSWGISWPGSGPGSELVSLLVGNKQTTFVSSITHDNLRLSRSFRQVLLSQIKLA